MGNQSTSGIVEEAKATKETPEKPREVISSPVGLKEENKAQVEEDGKRDYQEKCGEEVSEETVDEDCESIEPNESNSEEGRSKIKNEEQDEVSSITILNAEETTDITSEHQEDKSMLAKETVEIEHRDVETKENELVVPYDEGVVSETRPDEAECGENDENLEEEQSDSFSIIDNAQSISSLESHAADQNQEDDPSEMIIKENGEECEVEIDSHCLLNEVKKVDEKMVEEVEMGGSINAREEEERDEKILEKAVKEVTEIEGSVAQENEELGDESVLEKAVVKECVKNEHEESRESVGFESRNSIAELKKCPSFDFGVSFSKQTDESDQTPLLYQDKTARRSVSSCSNLRFETQYLAKYEGVEVEEKTIRMERSNSESISKHETTGLKASPSSKDDASLVLGRANSKRKSRSSLFTTCICCTAAIS